ncbi:MAG: TonB-dependent receptor [Rhodanobacteraceae bacterium]
MKFRKSMLSASIAAALLFAATAQASGAPQQDQTTTNNQQQTATGQQSGTQSSVQKLGTIQVVGIRASLWKSLQTKRNANATVDVVTAEDIGKFPNTNVAEAMTLMPGVTIDRRFGQGERVSINGTDPSLNLSFLDGHPIAQVDWLYGASPDRGFDYTILAPGIVGQIEVYKTSEARLPSGSLGGTVIIHSRKPLDQPSNALSASVGEVYNEQASKGKPNAAIFYNWKNTSDTFGVNVGVSHYEEQIDREGREIFGYSPVSAFASNPAVANELATGTIRPTDLMPQEINAAYFQQTRKRNSALVNLEFKPNDQLEFDLSGLYIKEKFNNWNQSMYGFASQTGATNITSLTSNGAGFITSGHLCGAGDSVNWADGTTSTCGATNTYIDNQVRTSNVVTKDVNFAGSYNGQNWGVSGQVGISKAHNDEAQYFIEPSYQGGYTFNMATGDHFDDPAAAQNPANWGSWGSWFGNVALVPVNAKTTYGHLDFHVNFDSFFNKLLFGVRYVKDHHDQVENVWSGGVTPGQMSNVGDISLTDILDNNSFPGFSSDQMHHIQSTGDTIKNYVLGSPNLFTVARDPASFLNNTWSFDQKTEEAYAQLNFGGNALRGNLGVRFVKNKIDSTSYVLGSASPVLPSDPSWLQTDSHTYNDVLPSFNLVYDNGSNVVYRLAGAKVVAWAPYTQMLGNKFLNDSVLTGSGGNPDLSPYKSYNFSGSVEWYFAPQSVLAFTAFYDHILNYISTSTAPETEFNSQFDTSPKDFALHSPTDCDLNTGFCTYQMTTPEGIGPGAIKGFSVSYQQPFGVTGFGLLTNYTYALGTTRAGFALPYNSKNSITVSPYFEKGHFTGRLTYNWRSKYLAGGYVAGAAPATVNDYTELDASLGWAFNKQWSVTFAALNLLDESYEMYQDTKAMPLNKYTNGRRYMATLHFKL